MEPEGSLPYLQVPTTCTYPEHPRPQHSHLSDKKFPQVHPGSPKCPLKRKGQPHISHIEKNSNTKGEVQGCLQSNQLLYI